jgi:putative endopeptidase
MRSIARASIALTALLAASACTGAQKDLAAGKPAAPTVRKTTLEAVGLPGSSALDRSVDPCDDFYQFACGGMLASTEIAPDKSSAGPWDKVEDRNEAELKRILEDAAKSGSPDPLTRQLGTFYGACMDEASIEAAGTKALEPLFVHARQVRDLTSLGAVVTELHHAGIWPLFRLYAMQDFKDATRMIANIDQDGQGLPDRDLYLKDDARSQEVRAAYLAHVERMMALAGMSVAQAKKAAADVLEIETGLARISKTPVELRDPQGTYNRIDRAGLAKLAPRFPWDAYFQGLGHPELQEISASSIPYLEGLDTLLTTVKPAAWSNYLEWHIVHAMASSLPKAFVDEDFKMTSLLTGRKQLRERYKRCIAATDEALGEVLGQPYVQARFDETSKQGAEALIKQISRAFGTSIDQLAWMDDASRAQARRKLEALVYHIGYPNHWRSYTFAIDPAGYTGNVLAARAFERERDLGKIGKPVDRQEWDMTPPTVNAYYNPNKNEMMFPAGILQPPFFDPKATAPVNLGAMGMIVGHELTHGFDDEGSQFTAEGNMQSWWSPEVGHRYEEKTQCLVEQYEKYEVQPGLHLNGKLTLGENIADNGGVKLAFRAYRELRREATELTEADGFSEDQQFFLAFAQAWCTRNREAFEKLLAKTDPHSPPHFRVIGPLSNLPEFAEAFSCKPGTPMNPVKRCEVW